MAKYALVEGGGVKDTEEGLDIPAELRNRHYRRYLKWLGEGNTPDPVPDNTLTNEQLLALTDPKMVRVVDWMLQYFVTGGAIPLADIPAPVKELYLERKALRGA